jgi:phage-related protein
MSRGVNIPVSGDVSAFKRAFKDAEGATDHLGRAFGGLHLSIGKLAFAFAGLFSLYKTVNFFKEGAKDAQAELAAIAALHQVMANTGATEAQMRAMEAFVEKTTLATGVLDDQLRPALARIQAGTKDTAKSQQVLNIAMDVAAARSINLESIATALGKAATGNTTALQKLGIQVTRLVPAYDKHGQATGKMVKQALSLDEILAQLTKTYGGTQAAIANADPWMVLKNVWGELKEGLGGALLPVFKRFADFMTQHMPEVQRILTVCAEAIAKAFGFLADYVFPLVDRVFGVLSASLSDKNSMLRQVFDTVWGNIHRVVKFFVDWFNSPSGQKVIKSLMDSLGSVMKSLQKLWEDAWPLIQKAVEIAGPIIAQIFKDIAYLIDKICTGISALLGLMTNLGTVELPMWVKVMMGLGNPVLAGYEIGHAIRGNPPLSIPGATGEQFTPAAYTPVPPVAAPPWKGGNTANGIPADYHASLLERIAAGVERGKVVAVLVPSGGSAGSSIRSALAGAF